MYSQSYGFSCSHVQMWELEHKEGWALKNWCFWTVVLEKTLESPLSQEVKPVNLKEDQPWIFIGRIDAETEAPILWLPDIKSQLIGKYPDGGKDWGQEVTGATEDKRMALLAQWTWVWASSGRWWRAGKPDVLQLMQSQRVRHNLATERQHESLELGGLRSTGSQRVGHDRVTAWIHAWACRERNTFQWPNASFPKSEVRVWNERIRGPGRTLRGQLVKSSQSLVFLQSSGSELYLHFQTVERSQENNILWHVKMMPNSNLRL